MLLEEMITTTLLPLAEQHVIRCQQLEASIPEMTTMMNSTTNIKLWRLLLKEFARLDCRQVREATLRTKVLPTCHQGREGRIVVLAYKTVAPSKMVRNSRLARTTSHAAAD